MIQEITEEYKSCTACGYEYQWDKRGGILKGDKDFIKIIGSFGYQEKEPYKYIREINFYMCPKCYTVKGNLDFQYNMKFNEELRKMTKELNRGKSNIFDKE